MPSRATKKRRPRFPWRALLITLLISGGLSFGVLWAFLPAGSRAEPRLVEIPRGSNSRQIAQRLKAKGIIRSAWAFVILSRALGESEDLRAGDYRLSPHLSLAQIIRKLASGEAVNRWVTVPEGYTVKQIADLLETNGIVEGARFRRIARVGGRSFRLPHLQPPSNLEGYLFPDTYKVPRTVTERQILMDMLRNFEAKVVVPLGPSLQSPPTGLGMRKTIVMASLIEREAKKPEERARIAGVLVNRLRQGMKLQVDATVQFALGYTKPRLFYKDLRVQSDYNTYQHHGLPPGPICNPGLEAIKAAISPESHDYLYYVARPDGSHIFSRTGEEHAAAIEQARAEAKQAGP